MGGTSEAITAGMHQFPRVFFHMKTFDSNRFQIGVLALFSNFNLDPALFRNRFVVLGDLVVLR
ncbi:MAG: Uncharacterised protein [Cyanobium sp. ARS6]|nr:MAG: Uncharacterised protein [Cyanobium sp. ARS6]